MKDTHLKEKIPEQTAARSTTPQNSSDVLDDVQLLWHELRGLIHDHFKIATLEIQQAAKSLVIMFTAGIMVAILLIGAWLGLAAAAVLWLIEHGVLQSYAILIAVVFNLLIALILCVVIRRKSRHLQFPAVRRGLLSMPPRWERKI
jgi:uncharacterized membrane protein YqjE